MLKVGPHFHCNIIRKGNKRLREEVEDSSHDDRGKRSLGYLSGQRPSQERTPQAEMGQG